MDIGNLTAVFGWMTAINFALLACAALAMLAIRDFAARLHGRLFGIDTGDVNRAIYGWLGTYKVLIIVFNLVPYLALRITG